MSDTSVTPGLAALLATRREGHGMPRAFYHDEALYAAEMDTIWLGGWVFAGFEFEIPDPGDFLTLTVAGSPVLVTPDFFLAEPPPEDVDCPVPTVCVGSVVVPVVDVPRRQRELAREPGTRIEGSVRADGMGV